jgi:polyisoprenoid-binding protein YceI
MKPLRNIRIRAAALSGVLVCAAAIAPVVVAARSAAAPLTLQPASRIWVSGTSNVKNFECKAVNPDVTVETTKPNPVTAVAAGEKAVGAVHLKIDVATMDCGSGTMNGHMKDAMNPKAHPAIEFTVASYALVKAADSVGVTLEGTLNIYGAPKPVTIVAGAKNAGGDVLHVTGVYELDMKDYGVKPPSLMLGTMRVGEKVQVHFDLLLKS